MSDDHEPGTPRSLGAYPAVVGWALLTVALIATVAILLGWDLGY